MSAVTGIRFQVVRPEILSSSDAVPLKRAAREAFSLFANCTLSPCGPDGKAMARYSQGYAALAIQLKSHGIIQGNQLVPSILIDSLDPANQERVMHRLTFKKAEGLEERLEIGRAFIGRFCEPAVVLQIDPVLKEKIEAARSKPEDDGGQALCWELQSWMMQHGKADDFAARSQFLQAMAPMLVSYSSARLLDPARLAGLIKFSLGPLGGLASSFMRTV